MAATTPARSTQEADVAATPTSQTCALCGAGCASPRALAEHVVDCAKAEGSRQIRNGGAARRATPPPLHTPQDGKAASQGSTVMRSPPPDRLEGSRTPGASGTPLERSARASRHGSKRGGEMTATWTADTSQMIDELQSQNRAQQERLHRTGSATTLPSAEQSIVLGGSYANATLATIMQQGSETDGDTSDPLIGMHHRTTSEVSQLSVPVMHQNTSLEVAGASHDDVGGEITPNTPSIGRATITPPPIVSPRIPEDDDAASDISVEVEVEDKPFRSPLASAANKSRSFAAVPQKDEVILPPKFTRSETVPTPPSGSEAGETVEDRMVRAILAREAATNSSASPKRTVSFKGGGAGMAGSKRPAPVGKTSSRPLTRTASACAPESVAFKRAPKVSSYADEEPMTSLPRLSTSTASTTAASASPQRSTTNSRAPSTSEQQTTKRPAFERPRATSVGGKDKITSMMAASAASRPATTKSANAPRRSQSAVRKVPVHEKETTASRTKAKDAPPSRPAPRATPPPPGVTAHLSTTTTATPSAPASTAPVTSRPAPTRTATGNLTARGPGSTHPRSQTATTNSLLRRSAAARVASQSPASLSGTSALASSQEGKAPGSSTSAAKSRPPSLQNISLPHRQPNYRDPRDLRRANRTSTPVAQGPPSMVELSTSSSSGPTGGAVAASSRDGSAVPSSVSMLRGGSGSVTATTFTTAKSGTGTTNATPQAAAPSPTASSPPSSSSPSATGGSPGARKPSPASRPVIDSNARKASPVKRKLSSPGPTSPTVPTDAGASKAAANVAFCIECGKGYLSDEARFCAFCGHRREGF